MAPTLLISVTSTTVAGALAEGSVDTFFPGTIIYSATVAIVTTIALSWLITTLVVIKRNLAALNDSWPPVREVADKPRPSFATEDVDAMRGGSSWVTSNASSHHESVSNWSFSTHPNPIINQSSPRGNPVASHPSIPAKSFWFNSATNLARQSAVPPRSLISATSTVLGNDPDPFRREAASRPGSRGSWLTSPSASQVTLPRWSYPTTHPDASSHNLPVDLLAAAQPPRQSLWVMANARVSGGYNVGYGGNGTEKSHSSLVVTDSSGIDVSFYRAIGWMITIWAPLVSLPISQGFPFLTSH